MERLTQSSLVQAYFEPKKFERSGKVYERLGVTVYRDYFPWISLGLKKFCHKEPIIQGLSTVAQHEKDTRWIEAFHLGTFGVLNGLAGVTFALGAPEAGLVVEGANAMISVYPIMLQRYNRNRIYTVLENVKKRKEKS